MSELNLTENEYWKIRDIAESENVQDVLNILDVEGREISDETDIFTIRNFSTGIVETEATEIHGLDHIESVYDRSSQILFPESFE